MGNPYKREIVILILAFFIAGVPIRAQNQISGRIYEKNTENPLPGTNVFIPTLGEGTSADRNGFYKITGLPSGKFKIQFSFVGYETLIMDVVLSGRPVRLNVELKPSAFQFQEIVITGGRPSSQHENAIKIETINHKSIISAGLPSLMKSIAEIPGVDVISKGNAVATPVIRGLSTSNLLVLNNGVRMENYQFSVDHPFMVDEFGTDKVEVIKGPASLLYGSDAIGGVLNFIKEKPAPVGNVLGDAHLQYFSNTNGWNTNIGLKGTQRKYNWGVRGGMKSHMDYLQGGGAFVPNTRFNQFTAKAFGGYTGKVANYKLYYDYIKMKPGMSITPSIGEVTERGRKNEVWYQDLDMHMISSRNSFFIRDVRLDANLNYQFNHRKLRGGTAVPVPFMVDTKLQTVNYEVKGNYAPTGRSNFILSIQGMSQSNRNGKAPEHVLPDYGLNDISLSGLVQHDFHGTLHFQVGLRYDNRFIHVPSQSRGDESGNRVEKLDRYYGNLSASGGVTYQLNKKLLLRGNIASAYRTPNIAELTQDGLHGIRYEQGNRDLKSQRNYEFDAGLHFHSEHFLFDFSAFYNTIRDYIFLSPTADTTDNGYEIYKYMQHNARIYGFEVFTEVLVSEWFIVKGSYGYLRAKQTDGTDLPFIPQNKFRVEPRIFTDELWGIKQPFFRVGMVWAAAQNHPSVFETSTGGYVLFDAAIGCTLKTGHQALRLSLVATNIFDVKYIDHLSTLKPLGYYDPGRGLMVQLSFPAVLWHDQ